MVYCSSLFIMNGSTKKIRISTSFQTHQKLNTEESRLIHMNLAHDLKWPKATLCLKQSRSLVDIPQSQPAVVESPAISQIYMKVIELVVVSANAILYPWKSWFLKLDSCSENPASLLISLSKMTEMRST